MKHVKLLICAALLTGAAVAQQGNTIKYSGPLVITKGGTYTGNWESNDYNVPAVQIKTSDPVIIENSNIRGRGTLIQGFFVDLTVRNSNGYALNPRTANGLFGRFVSLEEVHNVKIENNYLEGTSGIYINVFEGDSSKGQGIQIVRNSVKNVDGRYVNAVGAFTGKQYLVQAIQLNHVRNVPGVEIAWNQIINEPRKSAVEENINLYSSSGTASSPMRVHDNYIQGAYAMDPENATVYSGGGIMIGDGSEGPLDTAGGYVEVFKNQIVGTSNQGIAVAGGHDQNVYDNRILSSGLLPNGVHIASTNVGAYVWDYAGGAAHKPSTFFNNSLRNNLIGWVKWQGSSPTLNNLWTPDCTAATKSTCENNQTWPGQVNRQAEQQEFVLWQQRIQAAGVSVGPQVSLNNVK